MEAGGATPNVPPEAEDPRGVIASGGFSMPSTPLFELPTFSAQRGGIPTFSAQRGGIHWSAPLKTSKKRKRKFNKLTKKQKRKQVERQQRAHLMRIIALEAAVGSLRDEIAELRQLVPSRTPMPRRPEAWT